MTALKPLPDHNIIAVSDHDEERKLLRKQVLNPVCAHPECNNTDVEGHHIWPRSFISNSSWYVRVPGLEKPILHVTGLCRQHHSDVEEHRSWIRLDDGVYRWYDRPGESKWVLAEEMPDRWNLVGDLSPQPGQIQHPKKKTRKQGVAKRKRRVISIAVPADEQEDGAGIFEDLVQVCRDKWAEDMGWSPTVPAYYCLIAAMAKALQ